MYPCGKLSAGFLTDSILCISIKAYKHYNIPFQMVATVPPESFSDLWGLLSPGKKKCLSYTESFYFFSYYLALWILE